MKIKRYIGKDVQDAMMKVRMDLGSDAVLLNTKKIRQKGLLKIFSKPLVEVLAAIDQDAVKKEKLKNSQKTSNKTADKDPITSSGFNDQIPELEYKVKNMERMLEEIYKGMQPRDQNFVPTQGKNDTISKLLGVFSDNLIKNNVDIKVVDEIIEEIKQNSLGKENINDIAIKMYRHIQGILDKPQPINFKGDVKTKVVAFVGPTGVGKTTTLSKIAAMFSLNENKEVGIITTDTYRIAAVEQLRTYSDILGLPIQVIYSPDEIERAIEDFSDKDLILLDTAGRSHRDIAQFQELKKTLDCTKPDEVYLLLSLTTDYSICKDIIDSYNFLEEYRIIFTKFDEAENYGNILNIAKYAKQKLSYVTTGQSVPDDIEILNVDQISKKLLGSISI